MMSLPDVLARTEGYLINQAMFNVLVPVILKSVSYREMCVLCVRSKNSVKYSISVIMWWLTLFCLGPSCQMFPLENVYRYCIFLEEYSSICSVCGG